jgi:hypothetical protein
MSAAEVWAWGNDGLDDTGVYLSLEAAKKRVMDKFASSRAATHCEGTEWRPSKTDPNVITLYGTWPQPVWGPVTEKTPRYEGNAGFYVRRLPVLDGGGS